jgi:hypothetical protein
MILNIVVQEQVYPVNVPDSLVTEATDFFDRMDADMDKGWQMSRDWIDHPSVEQRCQIAGDKMLTAMHQDNKKMLMLLCAYVLARVPGVTGIRIDTNGEMMETELVLAE